MDARLDTLSTELYQVNTHVSRIARWQARMGGFISSPSPSSSLQALEDEDDDDGFGDDDEDEEMTASQWPALCHSWQKWEVVLGCLTHLLGLPGRPSSLIRVVGQCWPGQHWPGQCWPYPKKKTKILSLLFSQSVGTCPENISIATAADRSK